MVSSSQELHQVLAKGALLTWYDAHRRRLPWREDPKPWRVLVSELMLQQTQVRTVLPRYETFIELFPSPAAMAEAGEEAVLGAWAGLGYYRRARALFAISQRLVQDFSGEVPGDAKTLEQLPGVGAYTAGAVASIAFGQVVGLVDGNVERVLARFMGEGSPLRNAAGQRLLWNWANEFVDEERPGDHNQALMELGARVCRPVSPRCGECPLHGGCQGDDKWSEIPNLPKRPEVVPVVEENRYLLVDGSDHVAWRRRPETGLYSKMVDLPEEWTPGVDAILLGEALIERRLSHRLLRLKGRAFRVQSLPSGWESGPVDDFLHAGPPKAVALLFEELRTHSEVC